MGKPLYELVGKYKALADRMDDGEAVTDEELAELDAADEALEHKGRAIVHVLAQLDADESVLSAEIERLTLRKRALVANRERLREHIKRTMLDHQVTKLKAGTFSISISEGPDRVIVDDETKLTEEFVRVKREPNKIAILAAFKEHGELAPGVHIERAVALRIR